MSNPLTSSNQLIKRACVGCKHKAALTPAEAVSWAVELCPGTGTGSSLQNGRPTEVPLCFGPAAAPRSSFPARGMFPPSPDLPRSLPTPVLQAAVFEQTPIIYFLFEDPVSSCWDEA